MTKQNLPLTYKPKIEAVLSGKCRQTIRKGRKYKVGDHVSFHGWEGKPYRSKWSFRTPYFTLKRIHNVIVQDDGIYFEQFGHIATWDRCGGIAREDFIDPPTGEELKNVLLSMHKDTPFEAQILRW